MFSIRNAGQEELGILAGLIREYRGHCDEEALRRAMFQDWTVKAMVMDCGGPAGYCLWYNTFSTRSGEKGMHIDSVYVRPDLRGQGLEGLLYENLARIAEMECYGSVEWVKAEGTNWADGRGTAVDGRGTAVDGLVRVEGTKAISDLWGHCHCHDKK